MSEANSESQREPVCQIISSDEGEEVVKLEEVRSQGAKFTNNIHNEQQNGSSGSKQSASKEKVLVEGEPNGSPTREGASDKPQKKMKKNATKCALCKKHGKKQDTKMCRQCRKFFHFICVNIEKEAMPKKYICQKCEFDHEVDDKAQRKLEKKKEKETERQLRLDGQFKLLWFPDKKKMDREKKCAEYQKALNEFSNRYPFYIKEGEIKFPVDDILLLIYSEIFEAEKKIPEPMVHPILAPTLLGDFLMLQNFIVTFSDEFQFPYPMTKEVLYSSLSIDGSDRVFYNVLTFVMTIYLKDILEKNKTQNVRALNDHSFFILIANLFENSTFEEIAPIIWRQICQNLKQIPSMSKAFQGFDFRSPIESLSQKLYVLRSLINGLSQVDSFHDMVSKKSERMQQMTKQRGQLVVELKKDEAEALSIGEKLKEMESEDKEIQNQIEQYLKKDEPVSKMSKEQQKLKKNMSKMQTQKAKNEQNVLGYRTRITNITKTISFVTTSVQFIGMDRNRTEYFLSLKQPNRMYVNIHKSLLDQGGNYLMYEGKQKIMDVMHSLNSKGVKEKALHDSIHYFIKEGVIREVPVVEEPQQLFNFEKPIQQVNISTIKSIIVEVEQKFTLYLIGRNCRWAHKSIRESFMDTFIGRETLNEVKSDIKTLQDNFLFVQSLSGKQNNEEESEEYYKPDQQVIETQAVEYERKLPIRLWGINAEKLKKFWVDYLEKCQNIEGLWICLNIFRNYIERYIKKKQEYDGENMKKQQKERQREKERERQREKEREKQMEVQEDSQVDDSRPALRRLSRKIERRRIYSNLQENSDSEDESSMSNEDMCEICQGQGEVLCCDTCPKAYHLQCLKLKQIPQGQWSCFKCLERMANERQTRSKARNKVLMQ